MNESVFAPIQLGAYELASLRLETGEAGSDDSKEGELGLDYEAFEDSERPGRYKLELLVTVNPSDEAFAQHGIRLSARIAGFFRVDLEADAFGDGDWSTALLVNGLSILYSTLRPILTSLAYQAGRTSFSLPTVNMQAFLVDRATQLEGNGTR